MTVFTDSHQSLPIANLRFLSTWTLWDLCITLRAKARQGKNRRDSGAYWCKWAYWAGF